MVDKSLNYRVRNFIQRIHTIFEGNSANAVLFTQLMTENYAVCCTDTNAQL